MMEIREILEQMLRVFDEKDWIQGRLCIPEDPSDISAAKAVCLKGAWAVCRMRDPIAWEPWDLLIEGILMKTILDLYPDRARVWAWQFNDHPDTTLEDVRLVLKFAIEKEA
jgi:hypothetical protein